MSVEPKTNITVQLTNLDGNIFSIIGRVRESLRNNGHGGLVTEFTEYVSKSSSYTEALSRIMEYVNVK